MSYLLLNWLNSEIQLSTYISDLDKDFSNGYYIAELLYKFNQISNLNEYKNSHRNDDIVHNYCLLEKQLTELNIDFSTRKAIDMINRKKGSASTLLYEIQMRLKSIVNSTITVGKPKEDQVSRNPIYKEKPGKPIYNEAKHRIFEQAIRLSLENENNIDMRRHLRKYTNLGNENKRVGTSRRIKDRLDTESKNRSFRESRLEKMNTNRIINNNQNKIDEEKWLINKSIREAEDKYLKTFKQTQKYKKQEKQMIELENDINTLYEVDDLERSLNIPSKPEEIELTPEEIEQRANETKPEFDDRINAMVGHRKQWIEEGKQLHKQIQLNKNLNKEKSALDEKRRQKYCF